MRRSLDRVRKGLAASSCTVNWESPDEVEAGTTITFVVGVIIVIRRLNISVIWFLYCVQGVQVE